MAMPTGRSRPGEGGWYAIERALALLHLGAATTAAVLMVITIAAGGGAGPWGWILLGLAVLWLIFAGLWFRWPRRLPALLGLAVAAAGFLVVELARRASGFDGPVSGLVSIVAGLAAVLPAAMVGRRMADRGRP